MKKGEEGNNNNNNKKNLQDVNNPTERSSTLSAYKFASRKNSVTEKCTNVIPGTK